MGVLKTLVELEIANKLKMKHLEDEIRKLYQDKKIEQEEYIKLLSLVKAIKMNKAI